MPTVIVWSRMASTYCFWFTVLGATFSPRWRQTTSSRMRLGLSWRSSAPPIASIVPGATSWPWRTRSESSRTTVSPIATSSLEPSRVSTLPRRKTSQSRWSSSVRMIASPGPASSVATSLVSSICSRATSRSASPEPPQLTRLPSARPFTLGMTSAITLPISFGELAPDSATASPTIASSSSSEICSGRYAPISSASLSSALARSSRPASR